MAAPHLLAGAFNLPPEKAVAFFQKKGLASSFAWQDMLHEEHDVAFTVAKMMDLDLLAEVRAHVDRAIAEGRSFRDFRAELEPILLQAGWWGKAEMTDPATGETKLVQLGSPRRLRTIYDTNLRTAYAAGHWERIQSNAERAPYVMYHAILDSRTRPQHRAWHGKVLRWDDPWWKTHTPPNGLNCRCTVIQISARDLKKLNKTGPDEPPPSPTRKWTNPRTGEILDVPVGVDPGWGYAPGASIRRGHIAEVTLKKIADPKTGAELGASAWASLGARNLGGLNGRWAAWVDEVIASGQAQRRWQIGGVAAPEDIAFLAGRGRAPQTAEIGFEDRLLIGSKAQRYEAKGVALTADEWKSVPSGLIAPEVVLFDTQKDNLLYIFPAQTDPRKVRIAVEPDFYLNKAQRVLNAARSVSKLPAADLLGGIKGGRYVVVRGKL